MASLRERVTALSSRATDLRRRMDARVAELRRRRPFVDHVFAVVGHYGSVNGSTQAGAITYYGFLSFFPILALAFFAVGYVASVFPEARANLVSAINDMLPGVVGNGQGEIPLSTFENHARAVGLVGVLALLYTGLSWLSGLRDALITMFALPEPEKPGFVAGKSRDLVVLPLLGVILVVSVALSGAVDGFSRQILEWLGLQGSGLATAVLWLVAHGLAIVATLVLFLAMYRLLAHPHLTRRALFEGALFGAVGFELLKGLANFLIRHTKDQPAFQAFGVALILVVWINYFARIALYGAAWAHTAPGQARGDDGVVNLQAHQRDEGRS